MKKAITIITLFTLIAISGFSQTFDKNKQDGKIYIKIKNNTPLLKINNGNVKLENAYFLQELIEEFQIKSLRNSFYPTKDTKIERIYLLSFDNILAVDKLIEKLELIDVIEYAESAPIFQTFLTPNDPDFSTAAKNWHLKKINAEAAWDISTGNPAIKVAILDNGIYCAHPDLASKVFIQKDLADGDNDAIPGAVSNIISTDWSHGTHTFGIAGAATNNGVGIASISNNVSMMAIKISKSSDGSLTAGLEGITWAADNGANVISMSWGGPTLPQTMQNVIDYAYNKGCVLVAAGGNSSAETMIYPAACNHVISVGSTGTGDVASTTSEYGTWIDVMSPGEAIWSTSYGTATGDYMNMSGTSMACPLVAGLCGLMLSVDPNLTSDKLTTYLKASCTNIESLQNAAHQGKVGAGRINAAAALDTVLAHINDLQSNFVANSILVAVNGSLSFTNLSSGSNINSWEWIFEGGNPANYTGENPPTISYSNVGTYNVSLTISDGINTVTETKIDYISVKLAGGSSAWIEQNSGFTTATRGVYQLSIANPNVVWLLASDEITNSQINEFTKTIDGGATWIPGLINLTPNTLNVNSIFALNEQKAWISVFNSASSSTEHGGIYVTIDGGTTWSKQTTALFNNSSSFPNLVHFFNQNDGFCMGNPINNKFEIYTTNDGGVNWIQVDSINIPNIVTGEIGLINTYEAIGNTAWFTTNKAGRIFKTINKGLTWELQTVPNFIKINKISFNDELHGIVQQVEYQGEASGSQGDGSIVGFKMSKTEDGGTTWTSLYTTDNNTNNMRFRDIIAIPENPGKFISIGSNGIAASSAIEGSSISYDYGVTWDTIDTGIEYTCVEFLDSYTGWAGGYNQSATLGGVYKWTNTVAIEDYNDLSDNIILYPNPTNDILNINLSNVTSKISITIINILGEVIYKLSENTSGNFTKSIDLHLYNKGLYIVNIEKDNQSINYKIILK